MYKKKPQNKLGASLPISTLTITASKVDIKKLSSNDSVQNKEWRKYKITPKQKKKEKDSNSIP